MDKWSRCRGDPRGVPYSEGVPGQHAQLRRISCQTNDANQLEDVFKRHGDDDRGAC